MFLFCFDFTRLCLFSRVLWLQGPHVASLFCNHTKRDIQDFISKSHCKLPGFLCALTPFDALSNIFQFPKIPFLVELFIYFSAEGIASLPQKSAISQHHFLFGSQWMRMFLWTSPFARKTENSKMSVFCFFFNWSKYALRDVGIDLLSFFRQGSAITSETLIESKEHQ